MRRSSVWVALIVLLLFPVSTAHAIAIAEWIGPWQVSFQHEGTGGRTVLGQAFGAGANDRQKTNLGSTPESLPGTPALAKSYAEAITFFGIGLPGSSALTGVDFLRLFRLNGSPSGDWSVVLTANLTGQLHAVGALSSKAGVGAFASIISVPVPPGATYADGTQTSGLEGSPIGNFRIPFDRDAETKDITVHDTRLISGFLSDGIYAVQGGLQTVALIDGSFASLGSAFADFGFDPVDGVQGGLTVGLAAAPTPEPTTLLLFGTTAAGIGLAARYRKRRGN
jgi:hypothetical protein